MQSIIKIFLVIAMVYGIFLIMDKNFLLEYIVLACMLGVGFIVLIFFKIYKSIQIKESMIKIQFIED